MLTNRLFAARTGNDYDYDDYYYYYLTATASAADPYVAIKSVVTMCSCIGDESGSLAWLARLALGGMAGWLEYGAYLFRKDLTRVGGWG